MRGCLLVLAAAAFIALIPLRGETQPRTNTAPAAAQSEEADADLERRLRTVLGSIERFEKVEVRVKAGVVRLSGTTGRASEREKIEEIVSRFPQVLYIDDDIEVQTDIRGRIVSALNLVGEYLREAASQLPLLAFAALIVGFFWLIGRLATRWGAPYQRMGGNQLLGNLIRQLMRKGFLLFGLVVAMNMLDLTAVVGAVLGTAGIVGLAIGFAFKDIIENYLAGVLLSARSPFGPNDYIQVGSDLGHVMRLTPRELVLMNMEGNHLRIPNSKVFNSIIYNFTRNPLRRFDFLVGVGSGEDLAGVAETGCLALKGMKGVLSEPVAFMRVEALGDFSVLVRFHGWVDQRAADFGKVQSEAIRVVKTALDRAGVDMPEPIRRVRLQRDIAKGTERPRPPHDAPVFREGDEGGLDVAPEDQLRGQMRADQDKSDEPNLLAP
ncbi:MAG TPA: mechanosensitive ion channel family protein [Desulfosarcina sp.]|nr:mechanosensitive ion channel family protein [Desulfosarcina sp.]